MSNLDTDYVFISSLAYTVQKVLQGREIYDVFVLFSSFLQGRNYSLTNRVMPRQESSIFFPSHPYNSSSNRNNSNSTSPNSTNSTTSPSTTTVNGQCSSLSAYSSQYVDPTVDLDTWRHMHPEAHDGPYW